MRKISPNIISKMKRAMNNIRSDTVYLQFYKDENHETDDSDFGELIQLEGEVGFEICKYPDGRLFTSPTYDDPDGDGHINTGIPYCKSKGGVVAGSFHTHPKNHLFIPSPGDFGHLLYIQEKEHADEYYMAVGGQIDNKKIISIYHTPFPVGKETLDDLFFDLYFLKEKHRPQKTVYISYEDPMPEDNDAIMFSQEIFSEKDLREMHREGNKILSDIFDVQVIF